MGFNYGQTLLAKLERQHSTINNQIKELETEQHRLQQQLDKTADDFSLGTIQANEKTQSKLNTVSNALHNAQAHRTSLLDDNAMKNYEEAKKVIDEAKEKERNAKTENAEQIKKKIIEIYELYDEAKEYDKKVYQGIDEFIADMRPYLSNRDIFPGGLSTAGDRLSMESPSPDRFHGLRVLNFVPLSRHNITGLVPAPMESNRLKLDE